MITYVSTPEMTGEEIELDAGGGTFLQQFGLANIHIENLFALSLALRNASIEKKIVEILQSIKNHPDTTDAYYKLMIEIIRACECTTSKHTRFRDIFDRRVIKSTHPKKNE